MTPTICANCLEPFTPRWRRYQTFCSTKCQREASRGEGMSRAKPGAGQGERTQEYETRCLASGHLQEKGIRLTERVAALCVTAGFEPCTICGSVVLLDRTTVGRGGIFDASTPSNVATRAWRTAAVRVVA